METVPCYCSNDGICIDPVNYVCECRMGYMGSHCEITIIDFSEDKTNNGGVGMTEGHKLAFILFVIGLLAVLLVLLGFFIWRRRQSISRKKRKESCILFEQRLSQQGESKNSKSDEEDISPLNLFDLEKANEKFFLGRHSVVVVCLNDESHSLRHSAPEFQKILSKEQFLEEKDVASVLRSAEAPRRQRKRGLSR